MKKFNAIKTVMLTACVASSSALIAQEELSTNATMQISNAFTLQEDTPLSFGTVRASQDITASGNNDQTIIGAGVRVFADGSAAQELGSTLVSAGTGTAGAIVESSLTIILAGSPATYTISGAAPNTPLQILQEVTDLELDDGNATDQNFILNIAYSDVYVTGGPNANTDYTDGTPNLTTDGAGGVTFAVGGTLRINPDADAAFAEGTFSNTYRMIVSY